MIKLETYLNQYDGIRPGISVGIVRKQKVIYQKNVGVANLEYKIPISSKSVFNLASVSKPFTALGILMLVEKGILSLDDKLIRFFPEIHYSKNVLIRHLLNHTSGIINYYDILRRIDKNDVYLTNHECFSLLSKETSLLFKPGDKFDYSNSNYVLLALLIEKLTKQSFNTYLQENIFQKIGMIQSCVYNEKQPIIENRAYGYYVENEEVSCDYIGALTTGDGCLYSTMDDLCRFVEAIYNHQFISEKLWDEAFTPVKLKDGSSCEYGYGWELQNINLTPNEIFHSGCDNGTRTLLSLFPEYEMGIIILANFNLSIKERRFIVQQVVRSLAK